MWDYIRVQFSWEINLLATLNEFYFEILNPPPLIRSVKFAQTVPEKFA